MSERGTAHFELGYGAFLEEDYARAAASYCEAAEYGHAEAQFNLGQMHYNGNGIAINTQEACAWFLIAQASCKADEPLRKRITEAITIAKVQLTPEQKQAAQETANRWNTRFASR